MGLVHSKGLGTCLREGPFFDREISLVSTIQPMLANGRSEIDKPGERDET